MRYTLSEAHSFEEEIKKSRFLTLAWPIDSPAHATELISQHSDLSASHNCWAWRFGQQQYRFSDDGEPGGTAGRPILAAIEGQHCDQVAVLVIRWYGGIQLGTGGLARAYGGGAAKCLQMASKVQLIQRITLECHVAFAELALAELYINEARGIIEHEQFDAEGAHLTIALEANQIAALKQQLTDLTRGRTLLSPVTTP
ncbi:YigZ family protein [Thiopseudomonas alkaliphila]|uniref:YigZ family protein n=1 Tax=Thiopseudomonas alkaliphila TaxID=1697053 RepID=A0AAW7DQM9_9GAMM|nr:YigZ family protein [Thiopseudomonas alkaliphila]MDM1696424.1 YigZ family protein [Thiopseudomonas alkaliphila]